jgi:choline dehydrogenase-like flavoprotein
MSADGAALPRSPTTTIHGHRASGACLRAGGTASRSGPAIAYLLPARQRHSLTIRPRCLVGRVPIEGRRAVAKVGAPLAIGLPVALERPLAHEPEIAGHSDHVAPLTEETMSSGAALAADGRATVTTQLHPCGTARIGPPDDPMAVIDQHRQVRVRDLRVVDASVMPTIPPAKINLTCSMIAEHASARMRDDT